MALVGCEIERKRLADEIERVQSLLGVHAGTPIADGAQQPKRKRRKLSVAGRANIVAALKRRWAEKGKAKAGK
jgi:hypothetical protein